MTEPKKQSLLDRIQYDKLRAESDGKMVPAWVILLRVKIESQFVPELKEYFDSPEIGYAHGFVSGINLGQAKFDELAANDPEVGRRYSKLCRDSVLHTLAGAFEEADPTVLKLVEDEINKDGFVKKVVASEVGISLRALASAMLASPDKSIDFFDGFADGFSWFCENVGVEMKSTLERQKLYDLLLGNWEKVEAFPTFEDLHEWVVREIGEKEVGDLEAFQRNCNRFGLRKGKPGQPRKYPDT